MNRRKYESIAFARSPRASKGGMRQAIAMLATLIVLGAVSGCSKTPQGAASGSDNHAGQPSPSAEAATTPKPAPLVEAKLRTDFGLPFVQVLVHGKEKSEIGLFMVDTGFDVNIIDAQWASQLGLDVQNPEVVQQPGGAIEMGDIASVDFTIGNRLIKGHAAESAPISGLGSVVGLPLVGILGHELLDDYVVMIDYQRKQLQMFDASTDFAAADVGQRWRPIPVEIRDGEVLLPFTIQQKGYDASHGEIKLDTGSMDAMGFALNFYESADLEKRAANWRPVGGFGAGGDTDGRQFRIDQLSILGHEYQDVLAGATTKAAGTERRNNAGTVGSAILSRQTLVLDYPRSRILLGQEYEPGSPVSNDRGGLWLVAAGDDFSSVMAYQVFPGSPAMAADIKAGDQISAINGIPVSDRSLGEWSKEFRAAPGTRITLDIIRDEKLMKKSIVLQEPLQKS